MSTKLGMMTFFNFWYWPFAFFILCFLVSLPIGLSFLLISFPKKQLLVLLIFLCCFPVLNFTGFWSHFHHFFFFCFFKMKFSPFSGFWRWKQVTDFKSSVFPNVHIQYYQLLSEHCCHHIPQTLVGCVLIFICLKYFKASP